LVISQGVSDLVANRDEVDAMEEVAAIITPAAASACAGSRKGGAPPHLV
jgi:hypothetical protein